MKQLTLSTVAALLTVFCAVRDLSAAKPAPPPPPPAAKYEIQLLWTGSVGRMSQAGDLTGAVETETGYLPVLYLADLDAAVDMNSLLSADEAARWHITGYGGLNNLGEFACAATYLSDDGALEQGYAYICRVDYITGTVAPVFRIRDLGAGSYVRGCYLSDVGTVGGWLEQAGRTYAFITTLDDEVIFPVGGPADNPAWDSYGTNINSSGQLVGRLFHGGTNIDSYRYTPGETPLLFDQGQSRAINNCGDIAGTREVTTTTTTGKKTTTTTSHRTFVYTDEDGIQTMQGVSHAPIAINDLGDIVSDDFWGFVYLKAKNVWVDLRASGVVQGTPADLAVWLTPGVRSTVAMNNDGVICGRIHSTGQIFVLRPSP